MEEEEEIEQYRLCIRVTKTKIITQVIQSGVESDKTLCHADSSELSERYMVPLGLTNVPCGFLTGYLIACRFKLVYGDVPENVKLDVGKRKENSLLMEAIVKGATHGGLLDGDPELDERMSDIVHGNAIAEYMVKLTETHHEMAEVQFRRYKDAGIGPDDLAGIYASAFEAISADPSPAPKRPKEYYKELYREYRRTKEAHHDDK